MRLSHNSNIIQILLLISSILLASCGGSGDDGDTYPTEEQKCSISVYSVAENEIINKPRRNIFKITMTFGIMMRLVLILRQRQ